MNDNSILWSKILKKINEQLGSMSYRVWFAETELYALNNGVAKILVPLQIHKTHLADKYKKLITYKKCQT